MFNIEGPYGDVIRQMTLPRNQLMLTRIHLGLGGLFAKLGATRDWASILDEYLFDAPPYRRLGAAFWPDFDRLEPHRAIWRICGVPYRDEPEVESGQLIIDKRRCWQPLQLAMHLNEHSDFYYDYVHGDKETFHMAWRMLGRDYAMVPHPLRPLDRTMCQHDFRGRRVFQHRNLAKWVLGPGNPRIPGFRFEDVCLGFLDELAAECKAGNSIRRGARVGTTAAAARAASSRERPTS